jgi:hypothetical protein
MRQPHMYCDKIFCELQRITVQIVLFYNSVFTVHKMTTKWRTTAESVVSLHVNNM